MKFIVAVVILAVATYTNASAIQVVDVAQQHSPVGSWGPALVNLGAHGGVPLGVGLGGLGGLGVGAPWGAPWGSPWGAQVGSPWGAPLIGLNQGLVGGIPAIGGLGLGHAGIGAGHGHNGQYVAANRGSVHVAPLVGHIQSVQSSNVNPAPGTTW